jgi:hypothetical protein
MKKKIHIHLGPHKTGSTAIQEYLIRNTDELNKDHNIGILTTNLVREIAKFLDARDYITAANISKLLAESCRDDAGENFIISSEDFSGNLPGRGSGKRPYPQLWRNIQIFEKTFHDFDRYYYFFVRDKDGWLYSAYIQSLKHRRKFKSFDEFCSHIDSEGLWEGILKKSKASLKDRLVLIPFENKDGNSSVERFCKATGLFPNGDWPEVYMLRSNTSPCPIEVKLLELINGAQCSDGAARLAKKSVLTELDLSATWAEQANTSEPQNCIPETKLDIPAELEALWGRSRKQVHTQTQPDILPDITADWSNYRKNIINHSDEFPSVSRLHMEDQKRILQYRFRGLPEVCLWLGLSISYLRRDTQHTEKAASVFQRLWQQEYALLLALLPTRWLISSFQTFAEHGINEDQRLIGTAGFYFGNLMKTYEGERSIEGLPADAIYPFTQPMTEIGFAGMDRYRLGGTDLMVNTLSSLVALSAKNITAGRVLQEFLIRMRNGHTVFSRHDRSRMHHNVEIPSFSNCWCFFEEPK